MNYRVLLVEDEESLIDVLQMNLELEGYSVVTVDNGLKAIEEFDKQRFDIIILDVMLPGMDGLRVCETIRLKNPQVPILMLSAKHTSQDRVSGLKVGADDYLVKPFDLEELLLRVTKLIQRTPAVNVNVSSEIEFGGNKVNFDTFEYQNFSGATGSLNKKEAMLLKLLNERKNQVVSREIILDSVWGVDVYPSTRTIDNYIVKFRKLFENPADESRYFHSVRGVGYKFTP